MHLIMKKLLLPCMHKMPQLLSLVIILHILLLHPFFPYNTLNSAHHSTPLPASLLSHSVTLLCYTSTCWEIHHVLHLHSTYLQAADMASYPFQSTDSYIYSSSSALNTVYKPVLFPLIYKERIPPLVPKLPCSLV